jgi:thiamine-phosphate pyrophosphorylase
MGSKKELLKESRLYLIIDKNLSGQKSIPEIVNRIKDSGVGIIQLRDKNSLKENILKDAFLVHKLLFNSRILFIINDYLDVAKIVDCDGVHLGQEDISIEVARRVLGKDKIIGISCHSLRQALEAQDKGADYLGIGPIFRTSTKPEYKPLGPALIRKIQARIKIPFFAIGGINQKNITGVFFSGSKRVAICRAILGRKDILQAGRDFCNILH